MTGVLQRCPNCGSEIIVQRRKKGKYRYECGGDCWLQTKWYWSEKEAACAWNNFRKEESEE